MSKTFEKIMAKSVINSIGQEVEFVGEQHYCKVDIFKDKEWLEKVRLFYWLEHQYEMKNEDDKKLISWMKV